MQRLAQPVRVVPHAAEHGELDDLLLGEVRLHCRERSVVVASLHQRHRLGPANRRFLPVVEVGRVHIVAALRRRDLSFVQAELLPERHVVRHAIGALVERRGLDDDQLLDLHIVRIGLDVGEADPLVRQHPARERGRLMRQHLREIADPAPLLENSVVDLAGLRVGILRLDHFHARHDISSCFRQCSGIGGRLRAAPPHDERGRAATVPTWTLRC